MGALKIEHDADGMKVEHSAHGEEDTAGPEIGQGEAQSHQPEFSGLLGDIASAATSVVTAPAKAVISVVQKPAEEAGKLAITAAKTAGKGAHSLVKVVNKATGEVGNLAAKIPVVGPGLRAVIGAAEDPFKFADALMSGRRIDRAMMDTLERNIQHAKDLAPYVQTVVSFVPGIGTGLAVGIAASVALADGRPINEAVIEGVRAAIPGGPIARGAFDSAVAITRGEKADAALLKAAIGALPVSDAVRSQVRGALDIAGAAASGKPLSEVALRGAITALAPDERATVEAVIGKSGAQSKAFDALIRGLPPDARRAITSGIALGTAAQQQRDIHAALAQPSAKDKLVAAGQARISKSAVLRHAESEAPDKRAFALATGLMAHSHVPGRAVMYLRDDLPKGRQRLSFDAGLAMHIGATTSAPFPKKTDARRKVGYYSVMGTLTGTKLQREAVVRVVSGKNAESQAGAALAIKQVRRERTIWRRLIAWLKEITT